MITKYGGMLGFFSKFCEHPHHCDVLGCPISAEGVILPRVSLVAGCGYVISWLVLVHYGNESTEIDQLEFLVTRDQLPPGHAPIIGDVQPQYGIVVSLQAITNVTQSHDDVRGGVLRQYGLKTKRLINIHVEMESAGQITDDGTTIGISSRWYQRIPLTSFIETNDSKSSTTAIDPLVD
jgi:hypothetical protein